MTFNIKVKNKEQKIKFNYALNFKANRKLGSKDANGSLQNDGAGILFAQVLEKEDDALINLIQLVVDKATENDALEAVEGYIDELVKGGKTEEEAYDQIFEDLKEEMLASGFFVSKLKKYIGTLNRAIEFLKGKKTEDTEVQVKELEKLVEKMNSELS